MTRRDFELIARTIAELPNSGPFNSKATAALCFATALADTNPRFDRARFLAACGVQEDA